MNRFLQIHFLTSYPSALLNRDDAGFAKRIPFGGVTRTRISSQCLKRHWRLFSGENSLNEIDVAKAVRSRKSFEKFVAQPLREKGFNVESVNFAVQYVMGVLLGESKSRKKSKTEDSKAINLESSQITVLGHNELDYIKKSIEQIITENENTDDLKKLEGYLDKTFKEKDFKRNFQAIKNGAGLDAAMFGRMVTSDILARVDAAVHVSHAFTVHGEATEADYFTACDDLLDSGDESELGAGHINSMELTTGLFYGYVVVDVPLLVSNLEGSSVEEYPTADKTLASEIIERLIKIIATVSPGAKVGSTAPYSYASMILVESGNSQPRTLANAFLKPVPFNTSLLNSAYGAVSGYLNDFRSMYPNYKAASKIACMNYTDKLLSALGQEHPISLVELAQWASDQIKGNHHGYSTY